MKAVLATPWIVSPTETLPSAGLPELGVDASFKIPDLDHGELGELAPYIDRIDRLTVRGFESLEFLRFFPNVQDVAIGGDSLKDPSGLRHLKSLKKLYVRDIRAPLHVLGDLTSLEEIDLDSWRRGVESLFSLRGIVSAWFRKCPYPDLKGIANWSVLRDLKLWFGRFEELTGCPASVESLEIDNLTKLKSLRGLPPDSQLNKLYVERCKQVVSLEGLERCRQLRMLSMGGCGPFRDLEPLRRLEKLEFIFLGSRMVEEPVHVDALYGLPNLKTLTIDEGAGIDEELVRRVAPECDIRIAGRLPKWFH